MPHLDLPGTTLYYETGGRISAPAMLLIHADIATLRMWDCVADDLADDHFVVRFDLRGYGSTVSDDSEFSDRSDAIGLLDHLGVERALVVGASHGGTVALDLALESPARMTGLVVIGGTPSGHPPVIGDEVEVEAEARLEEVDQLGDRALHAELEVRLRAIGLARHESDLDPEFVQLAYALNRSNVARADENPVAIPLDPPAFGRLDEVRMPTLVVIGEHDLTSPQLGSAYLLENIPDATGARFARSAHLPSVEHPREFVRVLREWLKGQGL